MTGLCEDIYLPFHCFTYNLPFHLQPRAGTHHDGYYQYDRARL